MGSAEEFRETTDPEIRVMPPSDLADFVRRGQLAMEERAEEIKSLTGMSSFLSSESVLTGSLEDWRWEGLIQQDPALRGRLEAARAVQAEAAVIMSAVNTAKLRETEIAHERAAEQYREQLRRAADGGGFPGP